MPDSAHPSGCAKSGILLAIDLGSTNFKAALFDDALERLGGHSVPAPYLRNDGDRIEMDADEVRQAASDLIVETCRKTGIGADAVTSVAVTSQAQNFTFLDAEGRARAPVISWQDFRSQAEAEELSAAFGRDWHRHCTFGFIVGQMQVAHVLWLRRHMPEVFTVDSRLVTLPGLVFHMLGGINLVDGNLAAMSGLYSLPDRGWRADVLAFCGLAPEQMPDIVPIGTPVTVKTVGPALGLRNDIFVVPAGNDQTAGGFGNGCRGDDVIVTLGTALVAYRYAGEEPGPYAPDGCWGPYPGGGYYEMGVRNEGCLALDWARNVLMPDEDVATFDATVAEAIPTVDAATGTFHPARMRTPEAWQGSFAGPAQKAYAVLEGITFDLHGLVFGDLARTDGLTVRVTGGGSHSQVWLQLIADILDCPVSAGGGDSLLGAAAMAAGRTAPSTGGPVFQPDASRRALLATRRKQRGQSGYRE